MSTEPASREPHAAPAPSREPDFLGNLRAEFADVRIWFERLVVLACAVAAGLFIVGFTMLTDRAFEAFGTFRQFEPWAMFLWIPASTAAIAWATLRWVPGASGSGIPQVMAALDPAVSTAQRGLFVSLRLSCAKLLLASAGLLAGLSIGREGPSVQVAAGVMLQARRFLSERSGITTHALLVAGGAAGIAAAFNTPLAGVVFAIEELSQRLEQRSSGLILSAIVLAGLIAVSAFGNLTYFGVVHSPRLDLRLLMPGVLVTIAAALLGGLFARLLIASLEGLPDRISGLRRAHPVRFAAVCGLAIAVIGWASAGTTYGSGYQTTRGLLEGTGDVPPLYVLLKFVSTWISAASGVPGGIFAPSLSIGAGVGHDIAQWLRPDAAGPLIAIGMCAYLAAVTQAPLTSFIIVMEMVDGHQMVLSLMAAAMLARLLSRLISRPLYPTLAQLQLLRMPAAAAPDPLPQSMLAADGATTVATATTQR